MIPSCILLAEGDFYRYATASFLVLFTLLRN